jgi:hypothetical protein
MGQGPGLAITPEGDRCQAVVEGLKHRAIASEERNESETSRGGEGRALEAEATQRGDGEPRTFALALSVPLPEKSTQGRGRRVRDRCIVADLEGGKRWRRAREVEEGEAGGVTCSRPLEEEKGEARRPVDHAQHQSECVGAQSILREVEARKGAALCEVESVCIDARCEADSPEGKGGDGCGTALAHTLHHQDRTRITQQIVRK